MQLITNHFQRYLQRQPWDFCWRIGVESTIVSIVFATLLIAFGVPDREFPEISMVVLFIAIVLVAPPVETLLLQALPIFIARKLKASLKIQVISGTVFFALLHLPDGFATFVSAGIVGGFYFSFAYAHWRTKSRWQAFWITAVGHAIHNIIAFASMMLGI
jgi:hypothetical protein